MTTISLTPALPEIWLAIAGMALLMIGVFRGDGGTRSVSWLSVFVLLVAVVIVLGGAPGRIVAFGGQFVTDAFAVFVKVIVLLGSAVSIILALDYIEREDMNRFEYPVLIVLATLGMLVMVSANDLITLYLGLELQSLALYVVAAFQRDRIRSTEAGLKYFVLGALSSGMLLYGCSLIYGATGATGFEPIAQAIADNEGTASIGLIFGIVFLTAGLAFKVSAVPFHMWTPDVYEGAPTPVTALFAIAPKAAAIALFVRVMIGPFGEIVIDWRPILIAISIGSMGLGAVAAINQTNIKRLLAYSSIGNMGYALVGLAAGTESGVRGVLIYMAIYLVMTAGSFAIVLAMRQKGKMVEGISDLAGLSKTHPGMALAFAIFLFSLAGIPPLAGFFGKLYVFLAAIEAGLYTLAVFGVLASVVGAFYYLRIIKIMYFDEATVPLDKEAVGRSLGAVQAITALLIMLFFVYPSPVLTSAAMAARALFPA
ncbi:MAG: NADH-quinone oxidoreductase subunit NuoN [Alphaproteobacteria bacterium]|nr:NADH-quinone oxidoreductase subunit NuoN [Alphaproteobacteria bacterium]